MSWRANQGRSGLRRRQIFTVNFIGKIPAWISLSVTIGVLLAGVLYSLYRTRDRAPTSEAPYGR
jgi:hypothetical protein